MSDKSDVTSEAGIDVGQRWLDSYAGDHFTVLRTYRDHPTNPTFLIEYEAATLHSRGTRTRTVTLRWIRVYGQRTSDITALPSDDEKGAA